MFIFCAICYTLRQVAYKQNKCNLIEKGFYAIIVLLWAKNAVLNVIETTPTGVFVHQL